MKTVVAVLALAGAFIIGVQGIASALPQGDKKTCKQEKVCKTVQSCKKPGAGGCAPQTLCTTKIVCSDL